MKIINIMLVSALCLLMVTETTAQQTHKTGTTAAQVLKLNVGPRAIGMGGAFTATSDDITAFYWNPGGLANIRTTEAIFNHNTLYADIGLDFAGFATYIDGFGTLGAFISNLSMDEMPVRTLEKPQGTGEFFKVGAIVIGVGYSRFLTDQFSIGFNVKYISETIYNMSADAIAFDIGVMYRLPLFEQFRIAASISNFGPKMKLDGRDILEIKTVGNNFINTKVELDAYDLPLLFRIGVAADLINDGTSRLTTAIDAIHPNDHTEYLNTGIEYVWNEMFSLRAGYNSLFELGSEKGLTFGAGVNVRLVDMVRVRFDYAYQDFGRLKEIHYFSVGVKL